jgi:GAF domain-containing protein
MKRTSAQSRVDDPWVATLDTARAEARRLAALDSLDLLDTPPEAEFDALVAEAAATFEAPVAAISLLDADRKWLKAAVGLSIREIPRAASFCDTTFRSAQVTVVGDATCDPRFAANPLVTGEPGARFYAGAPLVDADGCRLGSLCIIDRLARAEFGADRRETLAALAERVVELIVRRRRGGKESD